VSIATQLN